MGSMIHAPARRARQLGLLLAEHAVVGVALAELLAEEALGGLVGRGHRRAVVLLVDAEVVGPEPAERELAGHAGQGDGFVDQARIHRGHRPRTVPGREPPVAG